MKYITDPSKLTLHNLYLEVLALSASLDTTRTAQGLKPIAVAEAETTLKAAKHKHNLAKKEVTRIKAEITKLEAEKKAATEKKDNVAVATATSALEPLVPSLKQAEEAEAGLLAKLDKAKAELKAAEVTAKTQAEADAKLEAEIAAAGVVDEPVELPGEPGAEIISPVPVSAGEAANEAAAKKAAEKRRREGNVLAEER